MPFHVEIRRSMHRARVFNLDTGELRGRVLDPGARGGHNESLSSPYHHENVAALRRQTHSDWTQAEMTPVRARVGRYRC